MAEREHQTTDVSPEVFHIGKFLDRLAEGKIRIPRFQRPFSWRPNQMCDLLDSIQHRFPIGSILVWETDRRMASQDQLGPLTVKPRSEGAIGYVLDGQQRLLTLLGTLRLPENGDELDWKWKIFYDLEKGVFYHPRTRRTQAHDLPVRALLGTFDFLTECRRLVDKIGDQRRAQRLVAKAERVADVFRNYQLPVIRITEADLRAAVKIFARLNTRGRRMTPDQMVSALTFREDGSQRGGFDLASEIDHILEGLSDFGFGGLDRVAVLRSILAAAERDIYDTDWTSIVEGGEDSVDLVQPLASCTAALRRAVEFLHGEGVTSDRLLPYAVQIILLSEFFRSCPEPSDAMLVELRHWFWRTSFTGWFAAFNQPQAKRAIAEIHSFARGERAALTPEKPGPALPFPSRFDGRSARVRAFLLYLMSLEPRSLTTFEPLNASEVLSELGPRALRYVIANGLPDDWHRSPANRLLLGSSHRGQAWLALAGVPAEHRACVFSSHGIPPGAERFLDGGDRERFVQARQEFLIEGEREFMSSRGVEPPVSRRPEEPPIDIEEDGGDENLD